MATEGTIYDQDYTDYQLKRSWLRKMVRRLYLSHTAKQVKGRSIDFGCGIGELLAVLPSGSVGLEINEATVRYCQEQGLPVRSYDPLNDGYCFAGLPSGTFTTLIMAHVLEHLDGPAGAIRTILESCFRLGIERIIIVVPGPKGFRHDKTHRTFIDKRFFVNNDLSDVSGYRITASNHFPFPFSWAGNYFLYNELTVIYDRTIEGR